MLSFEVSLEFSPSLVGCNFLFCARIPPSTSRFVLGLIFQTKLIVLGSMDYLLLLQDVPILQCHHTM